MSELTEFEKWWYTSGSGIIPYDNEDMEEFARRVARHAWYEAIQRRLTPRDALSLSLYGMLLARSGHRYNTGRGYCHGFTTTIFYWRLHMETDWKDASKELPAEGELVLCIQQMTGFCLRSIRAGEWYDEHENLDDSELEIYYWTELPEQP